MKKWNERAIAFYDQIRQEYKFSEDEMSILHGACQNLSNFWDAQDLLSQDGLVIIEPGKLPRKNPAMEVLKYSWTMFLQGCKHLGIGLPGEQQKRPYGVNI